MRILISNKKHTEELSTVIARLADALHCSQIADKYVRGACGNDLQIIDSYDELKQLSPTNKPVYISTNCIGELVQEVGAMLSYTEDMQDYVEEVINELRQANTPWFTKLFNRLCKRKTN